MLNNFKKLYYCVFSVFILSHSQQVFALQPINDHQLANTVGEQSPIEIMPQNLQAHQNISISATIQEPTSEQSSPNLSIMEQQVLDSLIQKRNYPLITAIENDGLTAQFKFEFTIQNLHTTAERNFGLEPFSMTWYGNYQDIVDVDKISFVTFNSSTGQYEFDNVRGHATVTAYTYRTDEKPVLLTRNTVSLQ